MKRWLTWVLIIGCIAATAYAIRYPSFGGTVTNSVTLANDGGLIFNGTARRTNGEWVDAGGIKAPGEKPASEVTHGLLETPAWRFADEALEANQQTVGFNLRLNDRMDRTVAPTIVIGWSTTTTDPGNDSEQAEWQLEYLWTSPGESTAAAAQETLYATGTASPPPKV